MFSLKFASVEDDVIGFVPRGAPAAVRPEREMESA
jgi:hypothetical protein